MPKTWRTSFGTWSNISLLPRIPAGEQVTITVMYLSSDAKLWWWTRSSDDAVVGRPKIEMWGTLKKELKDQFLPMNTTWIARESLKKLK